jgi:hypothetical protein
MNTITKVIIIFISVIAISLVSFWLIFYISTGNTHPVLSSSCGNDFDSGFKNAIKTDNPNFCLTFDLDSINQSTDLYGQHSCIVPQFGKFKSSGLLSKGVVNESLTDQCLLEFAGQTHDIDACTLITTHFRDTCILRLVDKEHVDYCNQVQDYDIKFNCFGTYGIDYADVPQSYTGTITFIDLSATKGPSMILEGPFKTGISFGYGLDASKANITDINGNSIPVTSLKVGDKITAFGNRPGDHATIHATKIQKLP